MYWVLVGPDGTCTSLLPGFANSLDQSMLCAEWKPYDPQSTTVSSRYFDGSSDWVSFDQTLGVRRNQLLLLAALGSAPAGRQRCRVLLAACSCSVACHFRTGALTCCAAGV